MTLPSFLLQCQDDAFLMDHVGTFQLSTLDCVAFNWCQIAHRVHFLSDIMDGWGHLLWDHLMTPPYSPQETLGTDLRLLLRNWIGPYGSPYCHGLHPIWLWEFGSLLLISTPLSHSTLLLAPPTFHTLVLFSKPTIHFFPSWFVVSKLWPPWRLHLIYHQTFFTLASNAGQGNIWYSMGTNNSKGLLPPQSMTQCSSEHSHPLTANYWSLLSNFPRRLDWATVPTCPSAIPL